MTTFAGRAKSPQPASDDTAELVAALVQAVGLPGHHRHQRAGRDGRRSPALAVVVVTQRVFPSHDLRAEFAALTFEKNCLRMFREQHPDTDVDLDLILGAFEHPMHPQWSSGPASKFDVDREAMRTILRLGSWQMLYKWLVHESERLSR